MFQTKHSFGVERKSGQDKLFYFGKQNCNGINRNIHQKFLTVYEKFMNEKFPGKEAIFSCIFKSLRMLNIYS